MHLPSLPFVVLDTETTGFVPRVHKVIEFASMRFEDGKQVEEYEQLFACAEIPPHVEVLTRIKTSALQGKPTFADTKAEIEKRLPEGSLIVGQNVMFDIGMLKGEGIDLSARPWIDTSMLASLVFPELESYSLGYLSSVLKLNHEPHHRALGDVRGTVDLLGVCWERLMELSSKEYDVLESIMAKAPAGYRMLFQTLPKPTKKTSPKWLSWSPSPPEVKAATNAAALAVPDKGEVELVEEPLDSSYIVSLIGACLADPKTTQWIAVRNLHSILQRLPASLTKQSDGLRILYPPRMLLDDTAAKALQTQETFTADEATLALKLHWYRPQNRDEFPLHGGEEAVWNGKVACTSKSPSFLAQFEKIPSVVLLEHRDLLAALEDENHPVRKAMAKTPHVIIDDASMLEDTATKAYGWICALDDLRAAAQGNTLLTSFLDTLQLWVEKIRQFQDIRYLTDGDLRNPNASGLRRVLEDDVLTQLWPEQTQRSLRNLQQILDPERMEHRFSWIEQRQNGSQFLHSVPERIGQFLAEHLFKDVPTTLLIPPGTAEMLPEILAPGIKPKVASDKTVTEACQIPLSFSSDPGLDAILAQPLPGKTIVLVPGRGMIEDIFVKHTERLEQSDITLICQGLNGGLGRMQAEFLATKGTTMWFLTPWMFESIELPPGSVDHLLLKTLPFDHPSHPVLSRRAAHYRDAFTDYSLPRLLHRLFRLLRTFCRFKTKAGDARILDERIHSKKYGKNVRDYLAQFVQLESVESQESDVMVSLSNHGRVPAKKPAKKKAPTKDSGQMQIF